MSTTAKPAVSEIETLRTESAAARRQRLSTGGLIGVLGIVLLVLTFQTSGSARFALSGFFDTVKLPEIAVPGMPLVLIGAVVCIAAGAALILVGNKLPSSARISIGVLAGLCVAIGFLGWAAAGRDLPFQVSGQLAGTITVATPLILGSLCGCLCERSGVVNVAIEGQFLASAFTATVVGSMTDSLVAAVLAGVVAAVLTSSLLALFALKYVVNQVVVGVVINLLVSGLTGFIFDQVVYPRSSDLNSAPIMSPVKIPLLGDLPFFGPIFFERTVIEYLAVVSVVVVWVLLYKTKWGLTVRAVGEHPEAADTAGINVLAVRWQAVLLGGVFAGLGGSTFTILVTGSFIKDVTVGTGFIALAALIMGRWHPVWAAVMSLFFGFVTQMAQQLQALSTPVPSDFLLMLPYVATVIAVAGLIGRVRAPAADGVPYTKA